MQSVLTNYPSVFWKQGWCFSSGNADSFQLLTGDTSGEITALKARWSLHLVEPSRPVITRLFANGLTLTCKRKKEKQIIAFLTEPGVLTGTAQGFPPPTLTAGEMQPDNPNLIWIKEEHRNTLYLTKNSKFALVTGDFPKELALLKAEEALEMDFADFLREESEKRQATAELFSINPRHNPPVALAAESLRQRLRGRTIALHGLWSTSDGFETETFSLNEIYPLIQAWNLIEPNTALKLVQTALSLQQTTGGFPAWVDCQGLIAAAAAWPMIIQSFELAWRDQKKPILLKKVLPSLRKYIQWALRRFDPHRDGIPSWQNEQEIFIPGTFERDKATPDLTVMLIGELEALLRLCGESEYSAAVIEALSDEHEKLSKTLTRIFWNSKNKAFSNVWKNGHVLNEPSFGSFLPLFWPALPNNFKSPLLENFEETHGFPRQQHAPSWKQEQINDTPSLPAIHQFMAFEALRRADSGRALLMLFVRRAREGFAGWFERESIKAARLKNHPSPPGKSAYPLGPIMAALILTTQREFQHETANHASTLKTLQRWVHRLRFSQTDLRIILTVIIAMVLVHLLYGTPARLAKATEKMSEAVLNYKQGQFTAALQICQNYPDNAISQFLRANLFILTDDPKSAEPLYRQALLAQPGSPSALFGYALSLQMNGKFTDAIRRYNDFLDIHEARFSKGPNAILIDRAYQYIELADEEFKTPPKWKQVYNLPIMHDLGL